MFTPTRISCLGSLRNESSPNSASLLVGSNSNARRNSSFASLRLSATRSARPRAAWRSARFGSSSTARFKASRASWVRLSREYTFANAIQLSGSLGTAVRMSASATFPDHSSTRARHARMSMSRGARAISRSTMLMAAVQSCAAAHLRTSSCQADVGCCAKANKQNIEMPANTLNIASTMILRRLPTPNAFIPL